MAAMLNRAHALDKTLDDLAALGTDRDREQLAALRDRLVGMYQAHLLNNAGVPIVLPTAAGGRAAAAPRRRPLAAAAPPRSWPGSRRPGAGARPAGARPLAARRPGRG
jgi:hypothetical protein